jgi:thiamine-monophosphate kinase
MIENEFVRRLTRRFPNLPPVEVGIGDDGAVLSNVSGTPVVVVTDLLLDGVHFDLRVTSPQLVGRKSIAVNLSDLAAMACEPTAAFISIAVPKSLRGDAASFLEALYSGIEEMTTEYGFTLAGGDTNAWDGAFAINVCLTGTPMKNSPVLRSGAKAGDVLFVTGPLGGSLHHGRHLTFSPRLDVARWLVSNTSVHAMMDLSDGLSMDLHRMMEASHTGAVLESAHIPVHSDVPLLLSDRERLAAALGDGEDFELLLSVSESDAATLPDLAERAGFQLVRIGRVVEGSELLLQDKHGRRSPLEITGWQHVAD